MRFDAPVLVTLLATMAFLGCAGGAPAAPEANDPVDPVSGGKAGGGKGGRGGTPGSGGVQASGGRTGAGEGGAGGTPADARPEPTGGTGPDASSEDPADAAPAVDTAADAPATTPVPDAGNGPWSALTAGWTEKAFTFAIHKPFNLPETARHTFDAATNTHTFWTLRGDKPHQPPPNTTGARSELRMQNDYTSGTHQFEADVYVVSGTTGACVMQVFGGITNATSLMLIAHNDPGGAVKRYNGPQVIKAMAYDRWWHLNVIHEANASGIGKIKVYADGQLMGTFDDRGNATHYFKCGVYNNSGARAESRFRNIKYWVK